MGTFTLGQGVGLSLRSASIFSREAGCPCSSSAASGLWSIGCPRRRLALPLIRAEKGRVPFYRVRAQASEVGVASPPVTGGSASDESGQERYDCVIVGAGISGLCTAQALATKYSAAVGNGFLVTEARPRVGGNVTTVQQDEYLWEEGPNSFQPNDSILTMAVDTGLEEELVLGDPDAPRFVYWDGRLRPVPAGPADLPVFDLMSIFGKLRAGFGAMGFKAPLPDREESVEEFVRRNLGAEVFERLIEPFCSGVYAGDPAKLSMKAAFGKVWQLEKLGGSIIAGTLKSLQERKKNPPPPRDPRLPKPKGQTVGSFQKGLITLPNAIADRLGDKVVKTSWKLAGIKKSAGGDYELSYETPEGTKQVITRLVVLTIPAYVASELLAPISPAAGTALEKFYYPPVAAVTISYPTSAIKEERLVNGELNGFGQLHPRSQGIQTLGTIYSSALFPGRAPEERVLLLNYIGGAQYPQIASMGDEAIVDIVDKDVRKMLVKADAPPPVVLGVRVWPRAIPQFTIGHLDNLEAAKQGLQESGLDGIFLGGNYVAGVALGKCVEYAYESAQQIASFLKQRASV